MPKLHEVTIRIGWGIMKVSDLSENTQVTVIDADSRVETIFRKSPDGRMHKSEKRIPK